MRAFDVKSSFICVLILLQNFRFGWTPEIRHRRCVLHSTEHYVANFSLCHGPIRVIYQTNNKILESVFEITLLFQNIVDLNAKFITTLAEIREFDYRQAI